MIVHVPTVLNTAQIAYCRDVMQGAPWVDGRVTAGFQSAAVKHNRQLPEDSPEARELGDMIVAALEKNPLFVTATLPLRVFPRCSTATKAGNPSARTWITRFVRFPARRCASARMCPPRSS